MRLLGPQAHGHLPSPAPRSWPWRRSAVGRAPCLWLGCPLLCAQPGQAAVTVAAAYQPAAPLAGQAGGFVLCTRSSVKVIWPQTDSRSPSPQAEGSCPPAVSLWRAADGAEGQHGRYEPGRLTHSRLVRSVEKSHSPSVTPAKGLQAGQPPASLHSPQGSSSPSPTLGLLGSALGGLVQGAPQHPRACYAMPTLLHVPSCTSPSLALPSSAWPWQDSQNLSPAPGHPGQLYFWTLHAWCWRPEEGRHPGSYPIRKHAGWLSGL